MMKKGFAHGVAALLCAAYMTPSQKRAKADAESAVFPGVGFYRHRAASRRRDLCRLSTSPRASCAAFGRRCSRGRRGRAEAREIRRHEAR